jgi:hypothetical protein
MKSSKSLLMAVVLILMAVGIRYVYYLYVKHADKDHRPWAYPDANDHSLVGNWTGTCTDADGISHKVSFEILNPFSDEKAKDRIFSKKIKRDRRSKNTFEGKGVISYNGKQEEIELSGHVDKEDHQKVEIDPMPTNDKYHPGFNVNLLYGKWLGNTLDLEVTFSFYTPEGFSRYESANPKHSFIGKLVMTKQ